MLLNCFWGFFCSIFCVFAASLWVNIADAVETKGLRFRGMWAGRRCRKGGKSFFFPIRSSFHFLIILPLFIALLLFTFTTSILQPRRDARHSSQASQRPRPPQLPTQRCPPSQFTQDEHPQPSQGDVTAKARRHGSGIRGSSEAAAGLLLCSGPSDSWR